MDRQENYKLVIRMYKIVFLIGFLFHSCTDVSKNQIKESTSDSCTNLPCCQLSNEIIYEKSIAYINHELGSKNEFTMEVKSFGDTVLYVKLVPVRPKLGGTIDLKIMTDNCEISALKIGK